MSEPLPSDVNVNFVCVYICMYVYYMYVCHGPARYLLVTLMIFTVSTLMYAISVAPDLAKSLAVL